MRRRCSALWGSGLFFNALGVVVDAGCHLAQGVFVFAGVVYAEVQFAAALQGDPDISPGAATVAPVRRC
jgi:hypothetical protein